MQYHRSGCHGIAEGGQNPPTAHAPSGSPVLATPGMQCQGRHILRYAYATQVVSTIVIYLRKVLLDEQQSIEIAYKSYLVYILIRAPFYKLRVASYFYGLLTSSSLSSFSLSRAFFLSYIAVIRICPAWTPLFGMTLGSANGAIIGVYTKGTRCQAPTGAW